jgi:hypothetical protein
MAVYFMLLMVKNEGIKGIDEEAVDVRLINPI